MVIRLFTASIVAGKCTDSRLKNLAVKGFVRALEVEIIVISVIDFMIISNGKII